LSVRSAASRWARHREIITGAGFLLLSATLRCAYVLSVSTSPAVAFPMVDSRSYHEKALEILAGNWLGDRIFYQDPLYPYFLAGLYAAFGVGSVGVLLAQAILDSVTVLLIYLIARRVFDYRCAVLAGLLATFYKLFFYYDALLLKVALTLFLITLALFLLIAAGSRDRAGQWLAAGFALGLAALTRGNYLLMLPVLVIWILLASSDAMKVRIRRVVLVGFGISAAILPVTLRNYVVGDDFVPITSEMGQNFFIGHFRGNESGRVTAPPFARVNPFFEEEDFLEEAKRRTGRPSMKPSEVSDFWLRESFEEIKADPEHFLRHTALKARLLFNHYEIPATLNYYFFREHVAPVLKLPAPTYGALLPLALCGMFFARRNRKAQLLSMFFLTYAASAVITYSVSRSRIPLVPTLIVFSAAGICHLADLAAARRLRAVAPALVFLALSYPLVYQDLMWDDFAVSHFNLGVRHLDQAGLDESRAKALEGAGDPEGARRATEAAAEQRDLAEIQLRKGLEIQPRHEPLNRALRKVLAEQVRALQRAGRHESALNFSLELTSRFPRFADGHALLGAVYSSLGRHAEARGALERALALSPRHREARAELARLNQLEEPPAR
jgi:4-amino-4-deoxy-L-arabinose transferase-like glycosyltransferase